MMRQVLIRSSWAVLYGAMVGVNGRTMYAHSPSDAYELARMVGDCRGRAWMIEGNVAEVYDDWVACYGLGGGIGCRWLMLDTSGTPYGRVGIVLRREELYEDLILL